MQSGHQHDLQNAATEGNKPATDSELGMLRDVFRMLPHGVTVQDEQGRFLLMNDAAAALSLQDLDHRRETGIALLRTGRAVVAEESITRNQVKQVFLTAYQPVRIADRNLLLSSSADISGQKAVEDQLFRSAYYD